ncbi:MAG: dihydropteroate synthase [Chloroflexi bacterium]|nr:MAG: dihydropteroate synthase [Chloroflexota bacterium]
MLLHLRDRVLDVTDRTAIMGILNVSDDSPVAFSRVSVQAARDRALDLARQGAEIIDIGAHSTRSNGRDLSPDEEASRVVPVIEAAVAEGLLTSVDTWTPAVARAAAEAGVHLLNDVTGFTDLAMLDVAREYGLPGCVMHMRGAPKHHREVSQQYDDVNLEVRDFLLERAAELRAAGVTPWLDPGFAFGKSAADNAALLAGLPALVAEGYPVLISASRKGFLAELMGRGDTQEAPGLLEATIAFNVLAASAGVHVVRMHDVQPMADALAIVNAIRRERASSER